MVSEPQKSDLSEKQQMIPAPSWPGAFGAYRFSKRVVVFNLGAFMPLIIASYIADIAASYTSSGLIKILIYIIFYLLTVSNFVVLVASLRERKVSVSEALDRGTRIAFTMLGLYLVIGIASLVSFILLIIPGFFVLPRLALAPFYLIDQKLSIREAIKASWRDSEGHALKIWGVILVQILFGILSLLIVGIYFSIVYSAALIVLYGYVSGQPKVVKKVK